MAKPVAEWTIADLEALFGTEESSNIEFKDGRSLLNEADKKKEIAKDVSAMANAAGGIIIYGIKEKDSVAAELAGIEATPGKAEWFEQVITNNIEPKVQGVVIQRIDLPDNKLALVVEIPQATTFAPHQSKQHSQYFRRYNNTIQTMMDHEVRDIMRRASRPELYLRYYIKALLFETDVYDVSIYFGNVSNEPALYSQVELIFERDAAPLRSPVADWEDGALSIMTDLFRGEGMASKRFFMVPHHMPIMREREQKIYANRVKLLPNREYTMGYQISAPGFMKEELFKVGVGPDKTILFEPDSVTRKPS